MARLGILILAISFAFPALGQSTKPYPGVDLNNTWTAANTFNGLVRCQNFENVQCVDSTFSRGGSDVGDEINKAYAALPANGGEIDVYPNPTAACYNFTTPIVAATASKYLLLRGLGASSQTAFGASNGMCLNYTPTTATIAITLDYVPSNGGGNARNHGIQNIRLSNNQCNTTGGCASSAIGVSCTSTNAGCQNAVFDTFEVVGFGTGIKLVTPASSSQASWGINLNKGALSYNTIGMNIASGIELTLLDDVKILGNTTGVTMGSSSNMALLGGSCDANTTSCLASTGGDISTFGTWYENQGQNNAQYVNAGLTLHIYGGSASDDCASSGACGGVTPGYWFSASEISVHGQLISTAGRVPDVVYKYDVRGFAEAIGNVSSIPRNNIITSVAGNAILISLQDTSLSGIEAPVFMADGGTAFSCDMVGTLTGWGSGAACSNPTGGNQRFSFIITTGSGPSSNPSLTVTLSTAWPVTPLYQCKIIGGTGTPALVTGEETTIGPTVIGPLILNATPSGTYQFSCMGI